MSRVQLRALTKSDIDTTLAWHNQPIIKQLYSSHPFPINREMEERWYDNILYSNFPTTVLGVEHVEDGVLIGIVVLKDIHRIHRHCEYAIYFGEEAYKGKGLSKEAIRLVLNFAFNHLGLQRVFAKILEHNELTLKLHERLSFKKEGTTRQSVFKEGQFHNEVIMAILKEEFNV